MKKLTKKLSVRKKMGNDRRAKDHGKRERSPVQKSNAPSDEELCWEPQAIWTAPPQQLPGPGEDPFVKALLDDLQSTSGQDDTAGDAGKQGNLHHFRPGTIPPVYPHVPAPTLLVDPVYNTSASRGLPDMDMEISRAAPSPSPTHSRPSTPPSRAGRETATADSPQAELADQMSNCTLNYVRRISISKEPEPSPLLHGQVWRGGVEKKRHWKRHQWVVER